MALFREKDRLAEDWRMLKISDPDDFALFPRAEELDFIGMVYDYPVPQRLQEKLAAPYPLPENKEYEAYVKTRSSSLTKIFHLAQNRFPFEFWKTACDLSSYFSRARPVLRHSEIFLRFNSSYPQPSENEVPHFHREAAITLALKNGGTRLENEEGVLYEQPKNRVILIGSGQIHYAPSQAWDDDTSLAERISFVVG